MTGAEDEIRGKSAWTWESEGDYIYIDVRCIQRSLQLTVRFHSMAR